MAPEETMREAAAGIRAEFTSTKGLGAFLLSVADWLEDTALIEERPHLHRSETDRVRVSALATAEAFLGGWADPMLPALASAQ